MGRVMRGIPFRRLLQLSRQEMLTGTGIVILEVMRRV